MTARTDRTSPRSPRRSAAPRTAVPGPTPQLSVAAVVVTYNSEDHIAALLDSLPQAFGQVPGFTVVVDNGSSDGTLEVLDARDDCLVVRSQNHGYGAGINEGVKHCRDAGAILVLNPDATLAPGAVPAMLDALASPRVGIVAPRVSEADGRLSTSLRRAPSLGRACGLSMTHLAAFEENITDPREYEAEREVDWAMGAVLLVRRACFDELHGFDESYFLYSEETDLCLRARDLGWLTLYTPRAHAMHVGGGSGESAATHMMRILNRVRFYRRRHGVPRAIIYYGLILGREVWWAVRRHPYSRETVVALLRPHRRPAALGLESRFLPG